jgi:tetratricopeptide (TPR) repeat protein
MVSSLTGYANFWIEQGRNLDSALEAARKSVELTSDYYNNYMLANILFKLKKYDEALKAAEKAVELVKPMAAGQQPKKWRSPQALFII